MSAELGCWLFAAGKAAAYVALFALLRLFLPKERCPPLHRPLLAGLVRLLLGGMLGIPLAGLLLRFGPVPAVVGLSILRLVLWSAVSALAYPRLPVSTHLLFAIGATALNTVFDFAVGEHWAVVRWGNYH